MPVQGANVLYTVYRRAALWCWYDTENEDLVYEGKAVTDEKGRLRNHITLIFPDEKNSKKTRKRSNWQSARFYSFDVDADVTDLAGETRSASTSLPLGTKPAMLTSDMPDKVLKDSLRQIKFSYLNAAGTAIDGKRALCYSIL